MKITKVTDHIFLVTKKKQRDVAETFIRFQEHYESPHPEIQGQIFTLGYLKQFYSEQYTCTKGAFTYYNDWRGFNFPSYVLEPFIQGLFDPLTPQEAEIVELFRYRTDKFYIIGGVKGDVETIDHEKAHGLWYTVPEYKVKAANLLLDYDLSVVKEWLRSMSYCEDVLNDECQAYVGVDYKYLVEEKDLVIPELEPLHKALNKLYRKYE